MEDPVQSIAVQGMTLLLLMLLLLQLVAVIFGWEGFCQIAMLNRLKERNIDLISTYQVSSAKLDVVVVVVVVLGVDFHFLNSD